MKIVDKGYSRGEMETHLNYDALDECWYIETNYRPHITKLMNTYKDKVEVVEQYENGTPVYVKVKLEDDLITFRKGKRVLSEEQKEQKKKQLAKARKNKFDDLLDHFD